MLRTLIVAIAAAMFCGGLRAHPVPSITVEAEFGSKREVVIKVNLDPRLFLHAVPTSVPAVPASWWFEQDDVAKAKTKLDAAAYVDRTFSFTVGATPLKGQWTVQPIDSASAFPLGQASTEAHLLVEHQSVLPEVTGDFKVAVAKDCVVPVLLLSSNAGEPERIPQMLFPGETSRPFPLPAIPAEGPSVPPGAIVKPTHAGDSWRTFIGHLSPQGHFVGDHLLLALVLGIGLSNRLWHAVVALLGFHVADVLGAFLVLSGWLPSAPLWMGIAYWIAIAVTLLHLFVLKSAPSSIFSTLAVAGWCHGMRMPYQIDTAHVMPLFGHAGGLYLAELCIIYRIWYDKGRGERKVPQPT